MSYAVLIIVGKNDNPIFELEMGSRKDQQHLTQFIVHSALDAVDDRVWQTSSLPLKVVDKFANIFVSAYVTPGHVRLMLVHEKKDDDTVKSFLADVHELYVRLLQNPFYRINSPIQSKTFEAKVRQYARKL